nr:site-specific integrase [Chromobacterium sp. ASV5]
MTLAPLPPAPAPGAAGAPTLLSDDDLQAMRDWLEEVAVARSPSTWINYRKEAERFLIWLGQQGLALRQVQRQQVNAYLQLLQRPPTEWINARRAPRGHPDWRPLAGPLKPASQRQAMTILHNCYDWLLLHERAGVARNPFRRVRVPRDQSSLFEERMLSAAALSQLQATIEALPRDSLRDYHHYYRARWLTALLLIGGLRREEVVAARMGDFRYDASYDVWTLQVTGKGNKRRAVTVTEELWEELRRYRRNALGLDAPPAPEEDAPLIFTLNGKGWRAPRPIGGKHLYRLVKTLLARAARQARDAGQPHLAEELLRASPHWFRHASITGKLEAQVPIEDVAEEHGHVHIGTTQRYAHKRVGLRAKRLSTVSLLPKSGPEPA